MEVFKLLGTIAIKNDEANKKIEDTAKKAEGLSGTVSKIGEMTVKFGSTMAKSVGVIGAAWAASVEGSREYRTEMGKLNAAFTTAGHTTNTAASAYRTLYGVIGQTDQAVEAAQQIALLADSEKDVTEWAGLAAGVVGRFGDALQPETFFESANETLKLCEATGAYVQMLEGVGADVSAFNTGLAGCRTEAERQAYMLDVTRNALGEAGKAYNENNKDIIEANRAQGDLTDTMAKIGEITEPAMTKLKDGVTKLVETALPSLRSFMEWTTENGEATAAAIGAIATSMAVAAVAAHPYAAAVTAVVAALAYLNSEGGKKRGEFTHVFDGYTDDQLQTLQRYVDAVNEAKRAEEAYAQTLSDADYSALESAWSKQDAAFAEASAIDGLIDAYQRWRTAQSESGGNDMYIDVPLRVDDESEGDMQQTIDGMTLESVVKLVGDTSGLQAAVNAVGLSAAVKIGGYTSEPADGSHASGLDYVPRDGYIARLHKGEKILSSAQASEWRGGGSARIEALLYQIVTLLSQQKNIVLDSGVMVGQLAPAMDGALGTIASRKRRGS